jgi:hypothetical protein
MISDVVWNGSKNTNVSNWNRGARWYRSGRPGEVLSQYEHNEGRFLTEVNLILLAQTLNWKSTFLFATSAFKALAEREGFEPPVRFPVHLISSQAPSTELGHLSA